MHKQTAVTSALSCSTSPAAVRPNPLTTAPVPFRKKARSSRAAFQMPNDRRAFRLRFRDGRYAPAPFPPSLRLRFTFPFAEPQAEAFTHLTNFLSLDSPLGKLSTCHGLSNQIIMNQLVLPVSVLKAKLGIEATTRHA